jgi:predicted dehydrogenase
VASSRKIRWGVVGPGYIAQVAALPAFRHAKNAVLTALVSDDPKKLRTLGRKYRAPLLVPYQEYEALLTSGQVDAVYISLPNHLHRDFAVAAAIHGVHVLCEKPMAVTEADCKAIIEAAKTAGVRLMIGYRLHFEKGNLEAAQAIHSGKIGDPKIFSSLFTQQVRDAQNIRLKAEAGGGTLYDIGIYCINAARAIFRAEPIEVSAFTSRNGDPRFREVDEMTSAVLRFPGDRLAMFSSSFGASERQTYTVVGTKGSIDVEPAFEFAGGIEYRLRVGDRKETKRFGKRDQFGPEIEYFSACVLKGRDPEPSGAEGLADVRIIEALYRSAKTGRAIRLPVPPSGIRRPKRTQEISRPPVRKPALLHAKAPSD